MLFQAPCDSFLSMNQNDINKQFSRNNNAVFGQYGGLVGSFILVFYLYVFLFVNLPRAYGIEHIFFSCLVMLVLAFLACLSVSLGYSRRRDHIVTCASDRNDPYPAICGDGTDEKWHSYLLGAYPLFFLVFFTTLVGFTVYSTILFFGKEMCAGWIISLVIGSILVFMTVCYYCSRFRGYCKIAEKAKGYVPSPSSPANSGTAVCPNANLPSTAVPGNVSSVNKDIAVNVTVNQN